MTSGSFLLPKLRAERNKALSDYLKTQERNVKFWLSSALEKCVLKPFISFYLSAAGVRDIAAQTVKKRKFQIYL